MVWKFHGNTQFARSFTANCPKLSRNSAFPQNFHTRKLDEILIFYAVLLNKHLMIIVAWAIYLCHQMIPCLKIVTVIRIYLNVLLYILVNLKLESWQKHIAKNEKGFL